MVELKQRIINSTAEYKGEKLAEKIQRRYQVKNTNGYLLNAFLDFDTPLDILTHIMIGSEGTLGFIAEAVLYTLPDYPGRYTGQLYFKNIQDAASAIAPIKESGARAAEIMDRAARFVLSKIIQVSRPFCGNFPKARPRSLWSTKLRIQNQFPAL